MNDESLEQTESQLGTLCPRGAPRDLRAAILTDVQRELHASRWDRRLARVAAVLLFVGVGLNAGIVLHSSRDTGQALTLANGNRQQSLVETAMVVAEATNARTGSDFARQLAAMTGHPLSDTEAAAVDAALRVAPKNAHDGKQG